jgi:hypothetical protein
MTSHTSMRLLRLLERVVPVFLPVVAAVVGAIWSVSIYVDGQREAAEKRSREIADAAQTRLIEAQKPFLDKQLELYVRASKAAGILLVTKGSTPEWLTAYREFQSLFWAELPMVESATVETAMVNLREALIRYEFDVTFVTEVEKRSYCLGHAIRQSMQDSWKVRVGMGEIPKRIFENTVSPLPTASLPSRINVDPDCNSEVRKK